MKRSKLIFLINVTERKKNYTCYFYTEGRIVYFKILVYTSKRVGKGSEKETDRK